VRINAIDTFETKLNDGLEWQIKLYGLSQDEALGLGYGNKAFGYIDLQIYHFNGHNSDANRTFGTFL
jgi:hypothetical protein